jgi:CMP-N-acetylneuraminic acid synthetase
VNIPLFYYRRHEKNLTNDFSHILAARREIKRKAIRHEIQNGRPFIGIIPCRRNYDFCTDLWKQRINGRTLLEIAVEVCLESKIFDQIVVACDNPEAEKTLYNYGDPRLSFHLRDSKETIRSRSIVRTLEKIVGNFNLEAKGVTVVKYIHVPFVTTQTLEESIFTLIMNRADSSFGVEEMRVPLYKRTSHGFQVMNPPRELSSDFDIIYRESSAFLTTRNKNFCFGSLTGSCIVNFVIPSDESFVIDSERALNIAKIIYDEKR